MEELYRRILAVLQSIENVDNEGRVNLSLLGIQLNHRQIFFPGNLRVFLSGSPLFELVEIDNSPHPPIIRVRPAKEIIGHQPATTKLQDWAYFSNLVATIKELSVIAINEMWSFSLAPENRQNIILVKFLRQTFKDAVNRKQILTRKDFSIFNTGLVTPEIKPIFMVFEPNTWQAQHKWQFREFYIPGSSIESFLPDGIVDHLPEKVSYFESDSEIQYTFDDKKPRIEIETILESISFLPKYFFDYFFDRSFAKNSFFEKEGKFYEYIQRNIKNDQDNQLKFVNIIKSSLDCALLRLEWDQRTAVPVYYPILDKVCFVLPAKLTDRNTIDAAFLIEKSANSCKVISIIPLYWAYINARFIRQVGSDWLSPCQIEMYETLE